MSKLKLPVENRVSSDHSFTHWYRCALVPSSRFKLLDLCLTKLTINVVFQ